MDLQNLQKHLIPNQLKSYLVELIWRQNIALFDNLLKIFPQIGLQKYNFRCYLFLLFYYLTPLLCCDNFLIACR